MADAPRKGIDLLRYAAHLFDQCNETSNQRQSAEELLRIADACQRSEWDYYPDQWTLRQTKEAIRGIVPDWKEERVPNYDHPSKRRFAPVLRRRGTS